MRAVSFSSGLRGLAIVLVLYAAWGLAAADVGGGSGHAATPWRLAGPEGAVDLDTAKMEAEQYQVLTLPARIVEAAGASELLHLEKVSLLPMPYQDGDVVKHQLIGTSADGVPLVVSLAEIGEFTVIAKDEQSITLSITLWPDLTADALLALQPSYEDLHSAYRRTVAMQLALNTPDGRKRAFSGAWREHIVLLESLPVGVRGDFYATAPYLSHPLRFWWAIPSVTKDQKYPYRLMPAAR